ncbi:MAG TPA: redox-sensing transcriptional repressor Rex [Gemmatimonadetes bacterium]|nr:redox-sensing transcriptional repressor Rex [Gemmatimonadota bacterium]
MSRRISDSTVRRLSHYLRALEGFEEEGGATVSSEELASRGHTTAAQVRKDLSHFGSFGKRGLGYRIDELLERLRAILGVDRVWRVVLVGAGRIGSALFEYPDFRSRGYNCVAILDSDPEKIGVRWGTTEIRPPEDLETVVTELEIDLVILAVPAAVAQEVADRAVRAGIKGILNFAPVQIKVPSSVPVEDVNLVMELEALSFHITRGEAGV